MKLNYKRTLLVGIVFFGISLINTMHDGTTSKILENQFSLNATMRGLVMAIDNILALFMLPIFGSLSDKTNSRFGKRKPFVFCGTVVACTSILLFPIALGISSLPLFIVLICVFLVALATYRSPGVSLVSDITIKPLRSKANAMINLMGAAAYIVGNVIIMVLYKDIGVDGTRSIPIAFMYLAFAVITIVSLLIYLFCVNEKKMTKEREELEKQLGLEDYSEEVAREDAAIEQGSKDGEAKIKATKKKRFDFGLNLTKSQLTSFILIFLSICFWFFGYNAAITHYSVYASKILNVTNGGFALPTLLAGLAGIAAYIPTGILSTKIGRKKTVLIGLLLALVALIPAVFVRSQISVIFLFIVIGIGQALVVVNILPMVVEFSDKNTIGKYTGLYYIATQSASALTPLLSGAIMDICAKLGIGGNEGMLALFPYCALFVLLAIIPLLFVKHGDSKPLPPESKFEILGDVD